MGAYLRNVYDYDPVIDGRWDLKPTKAPVRRVTWLLGGVAIMSLMWVQSRSTFSLERSFRAIQLPAGRTTPKLHSDPKPIRPIQHRSRRF